jgi:hypothetical protein
MMTKPWASILTAGAMTAVGASLIAAPDTYRHEAYRYTFAVIPPRWWGVGFVIAAVAFIGGILAPDWQYHRHHVQMALAATCAGFMAAVLVSWAGFLIAARLDTTIGLSWNGPIMWTFAALVHLLDFARFGTGRKTPT